MNLKSNYTYDSSHLPWAGPLPGDIAEVEAYCRIFRAAERFHNALMNALCNPVTGECSVSYDVPSEDKPLLEEKIVSVLGCMVCLLNKGREDVLVGRSSIMNSFRDLDKSGMDDKLPPLANFRYEMKSYCESLHVALENYLVPGDDRSLNVWRKLQRLKNVCYDNGFPRADGHPCQTLLANWSAVYFSTSKEEAQSDNMAIAFWKGGQVTEESLNWLLEKGFRTIIDLRAETVKDNFYESVLCEAILSGQIELISIPVEVGTMPSAEQVEQFAALVSDSSKKPIYVHSKEGKRRTSSMVSRWRQYIDRVASAKRRAITSDLVSQDTQELEDSDFSMNFDVGKSSDNGNGSVLQKSDNSYTNAVAFNDLETPSIQKQSQNTMGANNSLTTDDPAAVSVNGVVESNVESYEDVKPMESQIPPLDIFSRREMSSFFRNKKISPGTYFSHEQKRLEMLSALQYNYNGAVMKKESNSSPSLNKVETMNGSVGGTKLASEPQSSAISNGSYQNATVLSRPVAFPNKVNNGASYDKSKENGSVQTSNDLSKNPISVMVTGQNRSDVESYLSSDDENLEIIEQNMCASATGVVRVQSRKKAEMFLVRTDGFSCTREKVTESSLAFTHPSTQQQMLLWKSTPKTVLLLKKLGLELMEEAKEVYALF